MELLKDWTACVCITLVIATIFSLISPNGKMGSFYKIVISLFVFISLIYPFKDAKIVGKGFNAKQINITVDYDKTISNLLEAEIKSTLEENAIHNSSVIVKANQTNNEINIQSVSIGITNEYGTEDVKQIVFDSLGINAEVHKIGD